MVRMFANMATFLIPNQVLTKILWNITMITTVIGLWYSYTLTTDTLMVPKGIYAFGYWNTEKQDFTQNSLRRNDELRKSYFYFFELLTMDSRICVSSIRVVYLISIKKESREKVWKGPGPHSLAGFVLKVQRVIRRDATPPTRSSSQGPPAVPNPHTEPHSRLRPPSIAAKINEIFSHQNEERGTAAEIPESRSA